MRVLVINRFLGGDHVPTGRMLEDVTHALVAEGHEVTAIVSRGEYAGAHCGGGHRPKGVRLFRLLKLPFGGRVLDWSIFWLQAAIVGPLLRWDRCVLLTDPPLMTIFLPLWRLLLRGRRAIWLWTMDLYPEALVAGGVISSEGFFDRTLRSLNNLGLSCVDGIITLGGRQLERLNYYPALKQIQKNAVVVPPWDHRPNALRKRLSKRFAEKIGWQGRRVALYAGNLGYGHRFEEIIDAARVAQERDLDWVFAFFVRGARKDALIEIAEDLENVQVYDYVAPENTSSLLGAADIHLITMGLGWDGVVVPSKLYGIEGTGAPILFVGPESADTAREVLSRQMGEALGLGVSGQSLIEAMERMVVCHRPDDPQGDTEVGLPLEGPEKKIAKLVTS